GKELHRFILQKDVAEGLDACLVSPDGKRVYAATDERLVCWDLATRKQLFAVPFAGPGSGLERRTMAITPDGKWLLALSPERDKVQIVAVDEPRPRIFRPPLGRLAPEQ